MAFEKEAGDYKLTKAAQHDLRKIGANAWAMWCLWFFGVLTALRLGLRAHARDHPVRLILAAGGFVGLAALARTADLDGQLVYEHGVGARTSVAQPPGP